MQYFKDKLESRGFKVHYRAYRKDPEMTNLFQHLKKDNIHKIWIADVVDSELDKRLLKGAQKANVRLLVLPTPGFLTDLDWLESFF